MKVDLTLVAEETASSSMLSEAGGDPGHPVLGSVLGPFHYANLGDAGGLTQFGVHLEELPPGSKSSFRHWHETEEEMVLIIAGTPTLVENAETLVRPGDAARWPAGVPVGHCLVNQSGTPTRYLIIGTRHQRDRVHYPDHDLITEKSGAGRILLHGDGTVRPSECRPVL